MRQPSYLSDTHRDAEPPYQSAPFASESPDDSLVNAQPITILLAEDHALVREGTRRLLEAEPDLRVVAEAGDGLSAVALASQYRPDVAILDIAMPGMNGIEATRQIKAMLPQIAVLALTAHDDEQYVLR
ncbi:MAG TPA: response regulator transcription factor, partial [Ktedonobacterales bacterium]|nr:response regulator transcription factor [Ktedonobacterales bacterium]